VILDTNALSAIADGEPRAVVGADTTTQYAEVRCELRRAGTPIPANDAWIAALCRQYALPILSQDQHFDLVKGIQRLSW
jgi:tRNA(fMet)-specific endonuclease VapC